MGNTANQLYLKTIFNSRLFNYQRVSLLIWKNDLLFHWGCLSKNHFRTTAWLQLEVPGWLVRICWQRLISSVVGGFTYFSIQPLKNPYCLVVGGFTNLIPIVQFRSPSLWTRFEHLKPIDTAQKTSENHGCSTLQHLQHLLNPGQHDYLWSVLYRSLDWKWMSQAVQGWESVRSTGSFSSFLISHLTWWFMILCIIVYCMCIYIYTHTYIFRYLFIALCLFMVIYWWWLLGALSVIGRQPFCYAEPLFSLSELWKVADHFRNEGPKKPCSHCDCSFKALLLISLDFSDI